MLRYILVYSFFYVFFISLDAICQVSPDIYIQQSDMPGYVLRREVPYHMEFDDQNIQKTISQNWKNAQADSEEIYIYYGVFNSIEEAYHSIQYHKGAGSTFFTICSLGGYMIGDKSWSPYDNTRLITFLRGNIVIRVFFPLYGKDGDFPFLEKISRTILKKIELSLSPDVRSKEELKKASQISSTQYQSIIGDAEKADYMKGYSLLSSWDSKWFINYEDFVTGRRMEWKNTEGEIIGIDIAEFASSDLANKAKETRVNEENPGDQLPNMKPISMFDISSSTSVDSLIEKWKNPHWYDNRIISGISSKGQIAVHVYYHPSSIINYDAFSSLLKDISGKISF